MAVEKPAQFPQDGFWNNRDHLASFALEVSGSARHLNNTAFDRPHASNGAEKTAKLHTFEFHMMVNSRIWHE